LVKKVGDVVTVNTKGLFEDDHQLMDMKVAHDDVHGLDVDKLHYQAINTAELAELTKNCLINCLVQEQFYT
jgi:trigger factor